MWLTWVEMVLGPFAETKGPRLPGRDPAFLGKGMTEGRKMDSRLLTSGMTTTDGCPITNVGHDGEEEV